MEKVFCEFGEHQVDENKIDIGTGYTVCNDCMKDVEQQRVKKVEKWFGQHKSWTEQNR